MGEAQKEASPCQVLIIGGGPVGLALALDLGRRGVRSTLIERNNGTGTEFLAKADYLNERSMEFCRKLGLRDEIINAGFPDDVSRDTVFCTSLNGHFIGRLEMPSTQDRVLHPTCREMHRRCPQFWFDPILARAVIRQGMTDVQYGHEFVGLEQSDEGVTVDVKEIETGVQQKIQAEYVVGCDGLASRVRKAVGIQTNGVQLGYSVSVIVKVDNLTQYHPMRMGERYMFIGPEGVWSNLTAVDGHQLFRFTVVGSEQKLDAEQVDMHGLVRKAFGREDIPFELMRVLPWRRSQFTAETFAKGRVFLCGDAAHTMSPTGGHGLNTGLGDVMSLGWILQALVDGWGGTGLIEAYTAERRPVAIRNGSSSSQNYAIWVERDGREHVLENGREAEEQRRVLGERLTASLEQEFRSLGIAMGYEYSASPAIVSDGSPAPPDEPSTYIQTSRPGHRAPHFWLDDDKSMIDLYGTEFILLGFGGGDLGENRFLEAMAERAVPVRFVRINKPEVAHLYERRLVLVRPDGMVAWRSEYLPQDVQGLVDQIRGALSHDCQPELRLR